MFQLARPDQKYPTKVVVQVPVEAGTEAQEMTCHFLVLPTHEANRLAKEGDDAFLRAVIGDWEGIADADGDPLPCTEANVQQVSRIGYFATAAVAAYFERFNPTKN